MKSLFSSLKQNLSRSRSHRVVWFVSLILVGALIVGQLRSCLPMARTLHLGVFSTSNWDVPDSSTYEVVDQVIARFERLHPGLSASYTSGIIKDDYSSWLSDQIVQGRLLDVFMVLDEDFNMLASLGALRNLDSYIRSDHAFDQEAYYKSALQAGQFDGAQYALPYQCNLRLMFVNTTLLDQEKISLPDWNWTIDDFAALCQQVTKDTDQDGVVDQCGFVNYTWKDVLAAFGVPIFTEDGLSVQLNNDRVRRALRYMQQIKDYDQAYYPFTSADGFDSGQVAFAPMSYAEYKTYSPYPWKVRRYSSFEWSVLPMPAGMEGESNINLDSLMMGISSQSSHPQEAWELLKLFVQDEQTQQLIASNTGGLSSLRRLSGSFAQFEEEDAQKANTEGLLDYALENSTCKVRFKKYEDAMNLLDTGMNEIVSGKGDIGLQLLTLERRINDYLRS